MDRTGGIRAGTPTTAARSRRSFANLFFGTEPSSLEMLYGPDEYMPEMIRGGVVFLTIFFVGAAAALVLPGPAIPRFHTGAELVLIAISAVTVAFIYRYRRRLTQDTIFVVVFIFAPCLALGIWFSGPHVTEPVSYMPSFTALVYAIYNRRNATLFTLLAFGGYAIVLATADGYPRPFTRFLFVAAHSAAIAWLMRWLVNRVSVLARSERDAHARLDVANAQLAELVSEQGEQIDRLGRLRRFLSSQIADTVMSAGGEEMLATHRRQIAVVFVDLRGFTAFSAIAEPEEVVDVLREFYEVVGIVVKRLEATVGGFAGDGVMAYFNDPLPCDDPAGRAYELVTSLREPFTSLSTRWAKRGFTLGYGAGIAYGYATLGTIGFEERSDYTPLGSVVNLASRLCDEAANGEVLLDGRAYEVLDDRISHAEEVELQLKGFSGIVTAHRVVIDTAARA